MVEEAELRHNVGMRPVVVALALVGCGVETGGGTPVTSDASPDSRRPTDGAIDAPPRACTGGDQRVTADGQCYLLFTAPQNWANANAACVALNARLAVLDTAAKHTVAKTLAGMNDAWIGLTDATTEMQFRWVDPAVPLAFTQWDPNEPNNGGGTYEEDCVVIAGARAGDWDDRPCSDQVPGAPAGCCSYPYICQY